MTEIDISKVLIEGNYATIMGVKYKRVEESKSPVEEAYKEWWGEYPSTEKSVSEIDDIRWAGFQAGYELAQSKAVPVDEPEHYDEIEWDEKDNPQYRITDEVVDRLIKQQQAQKLYNRLYDELGYDFEDIENVVGLVEDWLPKPQSAEGSQNVNTELLVDGFNDCLEKIKGMLR